LFVLVSVESSNLMWGRAGCVASSTSCGAPSCHRDALPVPPVLPQHHATAAPPSHVVPHVPARHPWHCRARAAGFACSCFCTRLFVARSCRRPRSPCRSRACHPSPRMCWCSSRQPPLPPTQLARAHCGRHQALRVLGIRRHATPRPNHNQPLLATVC
jgi:hypothetical protein